MNSDSPHLTFACELETPALERLFENPAVIPELQKLDAQLALGIIDLSEGRAAVVKRLNQAGVPVVAWQLLPKEQGYWFNVGNHAHAAARYQDFKAWTVEHDLRWAGMGLDIEPDIREFQQLMKNPWEIAPILLARLVDTRRLRQAQAAYRALIAEMHADGYPVDAYQFPFIVDERKTRSTLLQRLLGLVDLPVDHEGLMLYTSFMGELGTGFLWSYGSDALTVGVGITGRGMEQEVGATDAHLLTWEELERDLHYGRYWCNELFIYSLEGCVEQDYLYKIKEVDWEAPVRAPRQSARKVGRIRRVLQAVLWASAHPLFVGTMILLLALVLRRRRR